MRAVGPCMVRILRWWADHWWRLRQPHLRGASAWPCGRTPVGARVVHPRVRVRPGRQQELAEDGALANSGILKVTGDPVLGQRRPRGMRLGACARATRTQSPSSRPPGSRAEPPSRRPWRQFSTAPDCVQQGQAGHTAQAYWRWLAPRRAEYQDSRLREEMSRRTQHGQRADGEDPMAPIDPNPGTPYNRSARDISHLCSGPEATPDAPAL